MTPDFCAVPQKDPAAADAYDEYKQHSHLLSKQQLQLAGDGECDKQAILEWQSSSQSEKIINNWYDNIHKLSQIHWEATKKPKIGQENFSYKVISYQGRRYLIEHELWPDAKIIITITQAQP